MHKRQHIAAGSVLWNGVLVTPYLAAVYNSLQDRINGFLEEGLPVPEYLLNASHKLLAFGG